MPYPYAPQSGVMKQARTPASTPIAPASTVSQGGAWWDIPSTSTPPQQNPYQVDPGAVGTPQPPQQYPYQVSNRPWGGMGETSDIMRQQQPTRTPAPPQYTSPAGTGYVNPGGQYPQYGQNSSYVPSYTNAFRGAAGNVGGMVNSVFGKAQPQQSAPQGGQQQQRPPLRYGMPVQPRPGRGF